MASFFFLDDHPTRVAERKARRRADMARGQHPVASMTPASRRSPSPGAAGAAAVGPARREARPPALFSQAQPAWKRWARTAWQWLWDQDEAAEGPVVLQGLQPVKNEFMTAVWDLQSYTASRVRDQILQSRSLRELWHLRADLFRVIAVHRGQAEAHRRLQGLDRHFPVRVSMPTENAGSGRVSTW